MAFQLSLHLGSTLLQLSFHSGNTTDVTAAFTLAASACDTGTNVIEIAWRLDPRTGRLIVLSAEDNIVKGASGQAVQSLNILCGFPETTGLA